MEKRNKSIAYHVIKASTGWFLVLEASRMISTSKLQCIHPIGGSGTDNSSRFLEQKCYLLKDFFQVLTLEHLCFAYWQTISLFHNVYMLFLFSTWLNNVDLFKQHWYGYIMFLIIIRTFYASTTEAKILVFHLLSVSQLWIMTCSADNWCFITPDHYFLGPSLHMPSKCR